MTKKLHQHAEAHHEQSVKTAPEVPPELLHEPVIEASAQPPRRTTLRRALQMYRSHKRIAIPLTVLVVIVLLARIPATRYGLTGLVMKKSVAVTIVDQETQKPVSEARVSFGSATAVSDQNGVVHLRLPVGKKQLSVTKKYYAPKQESVFVPITKEATPKLSLKATGRQVYVQVTNAITGAGIGNARIAVLDTKAVTDAKGMATIVLPTTAAEYPIMIDGDSYNSVKATVRVQSDASSNSYKLTPGGRLYFLSNASGKIDVVSTNLDGSDRKIVLAGTGREEQGQTILLASRDWQYLALQARREGDQAKLYLIETQTGKLSVMDEGDITITPAGWSGHTFAYTITRNNLQYWEAKRQALKTYDADNKKVVLIDETQSAGGQYDYARQSFTKVYILQNELVYGYNWDRAYYASNALSGKQGAIISVRPDGTGKRAVQSFPLKESAYYYELQMQLYEPQGIYLRVPNDPDKPQFYEYEDGKLAQLPDYTDTQFNAVPYKTYLISPDGKRSFWSEQRDGKSKLYIGNENAQSSKEIASLSELTAYGWYTDSYVLLTKNGSELYVMSAEGGTPQKITDYYKPDARLYGYGYGYGGL